MTLRENALAILRYQPYDKVPVISFGYWGETLDKWAQEGHVSKEDAISYQKGGDNSPGDLNIMKQLGFDYNWSSNIGFHAGLFPAFEKEILEVKPDGSQIVRDESGLIVLEKPGVVSIPAEIGTSLIDRNAWETLYLPRMQFSLDRINLEQVKALPKPADREVPVSIFCGSMIGTMRNYLGVEHLSYLYADDEELYREIAQTFSDISYNAIKVMLETGTEFDSAHYWEDICFKNGPLVSPWVFDEIIGPHYKRNSDLLNSYGIDIISLDCDGMIDKLIPTWLENGVNTMFPIEVGTWNASIEPWREQYGKQIRGVGGMNKTVFGHDYKAIDQEIERLKRLIDLGGFIPCPDHRIAPDAKFENVQYYCEKMQNLTV